MEFLRRMWRASLLDVDLYEAVERDPQATREAFFVVLIVGVCTGLGSALGGGTGFLAGILAGLFGWVFWSFLIYLIGVKAFGHTSDMGELLRCLGFAYSPGVLNLLGGIPVLGALLRLVVSIWLLITFVVAVRQALDVETGRALGISALGFVLYVGLGVLLLALAGGM